MFCRVLQPGEVSELAHAQLSETVAVAAKFGTAAWQVASAEAVWFAAIIVGGVTSLTVAVCEHDAAPVRWASSSATSAYGPGALCERAIQVIVVTPVEKGASELNRVQLAPLRS